MPTSSLSLRDVDAVTDRGICPPRRDLPGHVARRTAHCRPDRGGDARAGGVSREGDAGPRAGKSCHQSARGRGGLHARPSTGRLAAPRDRPGSRSDPAEDHLPPRPSEPRHESLPPPPPSRQRPARHGGGLLDDDAGRGSCRTLLERAAVRLPGGPTGKCAKIAAIAAIVLTLALLATSAVAEDDFELAPIPSIKNEERHPVRRM